MTKVFNFDLDGTLADLYSVTDWLPKLRAEDASPYLEAVPLVKMSRLAYYINKAQRNGWQVNIVSWCSKNASADYDSAVIAAKKRWLMEHLPSVKFDRLIIVPYGTPKHTLTQGFLFDDEAKNREGWNNASKSNRAFDADMIFEVMRDLLK